MVAALAVLVGIAWAGPGPARADEEAWTGLRDAGAAVADLAHGHVFVSEGDWRSRIAVTDLQGQLLTTITGLGGPSGMALSRDGATLYVALHTGQGIAEVDTHTLTVTSTLPLPAPVRCPNSVAESGGALFVEFGCLYAPAGLARLDLASGSVQVEPMDVPGTTQPYAPIGGHDEMLTAPSNPDLLVVATRDDPATTYVYNTATDPPTLQTGNGGGGLHAGDFALSPDGATLIDGTYQGLYTSPVSDPGAQTLVSQQPADTIALSPDGTRLAVGRPYGSLCVLSTQTWSTIRCHDGLRGNVDPPAAVVSLGGDAAAMTAVSTERSSTTQGPPGGWLEILDDPQRALTTLYLSTPDPIVLIPQDVGRSGTITIGQAVTINGKITAPSTAGVQLTVRRQGPIGPELSLLPVVPAADGSFTITDRPLAAGRYRYTVQYAGSATQSPSIGEYDLDVQPPLLSAGLSDVKQNLAGDLLDDPVHHRVFVAEGEAGDVRVFDETGQELGTITNLPGVSDLLLSADRSVLYAAVPAADEVVALDPTLLVVTRVWPTGTVHEPSQLALLGTRMLVGYGGAQSGGVGGIAAFDTATPVPVMTVLSDPGTQPDSQELLTDPSVPNGVLAVDQQGNDHHVVLYQVGPSSLTTLAETNGCDSPPAMSTDQQSVYCGGLELDAQTLAWKRSLGMSSVTPSPSPDLSVGSGWI